MEQAYRRYCQAAAFVLVTLYTVPTKLLQGRLEHDSRGLLLGTPLAIALGVPENLFHLLLSVPAVAVVLLDLRSARSQVPGRG